MSSYLLNMSLAPGERNIRPDDGDVDGVCVPLVIAVADAFALDGARSLIDVRDLRPKPQLFAKLAKAPCEPCGRLVDAEDCIESGEVLSLRVTLETADVVRRLPSTTLDSPSVREPSGLGVPLSPLVNPSLVGVSGRSVNLGSDNAVVAAAFGAWDADLVKGCLLAEKTLDVDGREDEDERRDAGC